MKGYEKYKISKFQWFDKIPEHWIEGKIKYLFEISRGRVISQLELKPEAKFPVYSSQTKNDGCLGYIDTFDYEGEMLTWTTDGANAGSVFQRKGQFNCTNVCGILTPTKELELRYYFYYVDFIAQFYKRPDTNGAKIMSNEMAEIHCFIPSIQEQTQIAAFLDYKTNLIDATIEKKKRLIELLKEKRQAVINEAVTKGLNPNAPMKDSGVEWLEEIPEHWEVTKMKFIATITRGAILRPVDEPTYFDDNGEWTYLNISDATKCDKYLYEGKLRLSDLGSNKSARVLPDNLILTASATIGKPFINKIPVCVHDGFIPITNIKSNIDYLYHYLRNPQLYVSLGKVNTQKNIYLDEVKDIFVTQPSKKEQFQIVSYLESFEEKNNKLLLQIENAIEKLQEYRQSLISEAVTGKIDVRDWKNAKNN